MTWAFTGATCSTLAQVRGVPAKIEKRTGLEADRPIESRFGPRVTTFVQTDVGDGRGIVRQDEMRCPLPNSVSG
jgi:hypothetical protein